MTEPLPEITDRVLRQSSGHSQCRLKSPTKAGYTTNAYKNGLTKNQTRENHGVLNTDLLLSYGKGRMMFSRELHARVLGHMRGGSTRRIPRQHAANAQSSRALSSIILRCDSNGSFRVVACGMRATAPNS
jgi:hypothetical protein